MNNNMYVGVVEDRTDPEMMNRVKVRFFGIHNKEKDKTKLEDLPWATVMMPVTGPAISGFGTSPHALVEGSWVVGFFRDTTFQDPIIIGSIATKFEEKPPESCGFADPNAKYPLKDYIGKDTNDVNRLAKAKDDKTDIPTLKKDSVVKEIPTAVDKKTWDEIPTPYAPVYPFNKVTKSESGHIFEVDDTEGKERLHEYHRTGTFREVHPDGTTVTKVVGDNYLIVAAVEGGEEGESEGKKPENNCKVYIKGNVDLTIDQNCTTYIKGNWDIKVDGNTNITIGGNLTETVVGEVAETYKKSKVTNITDKMTETTGGAVSETYGGDQTTIAPNIHLNP